MKPSRYIKYKSTQEARIRRRLRWKNVFLDEGRISSKINPFNYMLRLTQKETAEILNITRQRVQQIERNAIWKIRQKLKNLTL